MTVKTKIRTLSSERKHYQFLRYNRYERKTIAIETLTGWAFLSPVLIVALIFSTTAIGIGLWLSLQQGTWGNLSFVGLDNWKYLFDADLEMGAALKNTLFFAATSTPLIIIISLVVSALLNSSYVKKKEIFLAIFFLPQVTSAVASTLIFKQLFSPDGMFKIDYYADPKKIMWVVIFSAVWGGVAGSLITMNTAFASIDKNQYEAADLDGANGLSKFLNITIPSIVPIIAYSLFMGIIGGLGVFDGPYLLAGSTGIPTSGMMTVILKGYEYIMTRPNSPIRSNIGLGTTILLSMALLMGMATFVVNIFMPFNKETH